MVTSHTLELWTLAEGLLIRLLVLSWPEPAQASRSLVSFRCLAFSPRALVVVEAFFLQKVVKMLEGMVVSW